ncbi:hypothetical protein BH10BAC2_BH10BAC2_01820 [soil metagenome]
MRDEFSSIKHGSTNVSAVEACLFYYPTALPVQVNGATHAA